MFKQFKTLTLLLTIAMMALLASCEKDADTAKPVTNDMEIGLNDSHTAYIGSDLHIEAEIVAEGRIDMVLVEILMEEGEDNEIEASYTEFSGLKNTTFHKHVDIPEETLPGTYHFHFTVTDQEGNQTTVEDEITIEELADEEAPVIDMASAPENGQNFTSGETISVSGTVTDNNFLAGMLVALVRTEDNIADEEVTGDNTAVIVMLHTHSFDSETQHSFTASIEVGAGYDNNMTPAPIEGDNAWQSGNYYILIKAVDAKGNWTYSIHYPIVINL